MPSSRGSSQPSDLTGCLLYLLRWQAGSLPVVLPGNPESLRIDTLSGLDT